MARSGGFRLLVTCEHGGNRVPREYAALFAGRERLLASHRGYDRGALAIARRFPGPLRASTVTRLLVDLNRSPGHPRLHADFVPEEARARIVARHYRPYRAEVDRLVRRLAPVLHLSVHSFAPVLRGKRRTMEIGLLFDPSRRGEAELCGRWQRLLRAEGFVVRRNAPYRGTSDGLTTALRARWPGTLYRGIELEVNRRIAGASVAAPLVRTLLAALPP